MSIAYLDPGNIENDLQAGAAAQYKVDAITYLLLLLLLLLLVVMGVALVYCSWSIDASKRERQRENCMPGVFVLTKITRNSV